MFRDGLTDNHYVFNPVALTNISMKTIHMYKLGLLQLYEFYKYIYLGF